MVEQQYYASFSFEVSLPFCNAGKEGIHQELMGLIKKQEEKGIVLFQGVSFKIQDGRIALSSLGQPFVNLQIKKELIISDTMVSYVYMEATDQNVMLPNIIFFINVLLDVVKTTEKLCGGFPEQGTVCKIVIDNTGDCFFYEKYSPLDVEYSTMLKYGLEKKNEFEIVIRNKEDVYHLLNRFYQQYKTAQSQSKPYVKLNKDSFFRAYDELQ